MNDTIHPDLAKLLGVELKGKIKSLDERWGVGYVELSDGSGMQFILKASSYPGAKVGQPVKFKLDEGFAVSEMGRDRPREEGLSP